MNSVVISIPQQADQLATLSSRLDASRIKRAPESHEWSVGNTGAAHPSTSLLGAGHPWALTHPWRAPDWLAGASSSPPRACRQSTPLFQYGGPRPAPPRGGGPLTAVRRRSGRTIGLG